MKQKNGLYLQIPSWFGAMGSLTLPNVKQQFPLFFTGFSILFGIRYQRTSTINVKRKFSKRKIIIGDTHKISKLYRLKLSCKSLKRNKTNTATTNTVKR